MARSPGRRTVGPAIGIVIALALAGCSDQEAREPAHSPPATAPTPSIPDAPLLHLGALTEADLTSARLQGELGCSFSTDPASPVLVAMGVVASSQPAEGIVKVAGEVERLTAPGGFDGMLMGATFAGERGTARIVPTGPAEGGGESPPRPATLTYTRADGASLTIGGRWQCGP